MSVAHSEADTHPATAGSAPKAEIHASIPAALSYSRIARGLVAELCGATAQDDDETARIVQAVDEAVPNAILPGYAGQTDGQGHFGCTLAGVELEIRVSDYGAGFRFDP